MFIYWESIESPGSKIDQPVNWLSWIPSISDSTIGLLGVGSQQGTVGITHTNTDLFRSGPCDKRVNFNLRGHHSPISIVEWNRQHHKLASCDESGIIHVWVQYEDRWTVELVNDRGVKIRDFKWSPNGAQVLICYSDSFILVGSVNGQRNWSRQMAENNILCGTWIPDESPIQIMLGTTTGDIVLVNDQGDILRHHTICRGIAIDKLYWSTIRARDRKSTLCVCFRNNVLYFMNSHDDPDPVICDTGIEVSRIQWSHSGEYLAVVGIVTEGDIICSQQQNIRNVLYVYNCYGSRMLSCDIPHIGDVNKRVSAVTWACNDQRLIIAVQNEVFVGHLHTEVPTLQLMTSYVVWKSLKQKCAIDQLPLPSVERKMVDLFNYQTIQCCVPTPDQILPQACKRCEWRWYCTIIPEPQLSKLSSSWALCLEHLGGLIPILRGRQVNKFRPEFEIRVYTGPDDENRSNRSSVGPNEPGATDDGSDSEPEFPDEPQPFLRSGYRSTVPCHGTVGPLRTSPIRAEADLQTTSINLHRDSVWRRSKRSFQAIVQKAQQISTSNSSACKSTRKLLQVTSNVWCTRFKLAGVESDLLPSYLGQVVYKTSVLHLQPRQMSVRLVDLSHPNCAVQKDEVCSVSRSTEGGSEIAYGALMDEGPPIAPVDFGCLRRNSLSYCLSSSTDLENEFPYVDLSVTDPSAELQDLAAEETTHLKVLREFQDLKVAVDCHIQRMRNFASDMQGSGQSLNDNEVAALNRIFGAACHATDAATETVTTSISLPISPASLPFESSPVGPSTSTYPRAVMTSSDENAEECDIILVPETAKTPNITAAENLKSHQSAIDGFTAICADNIAGDNGCSIEVVSKNASTLGSGEQNSLHMSRTQRLLRSFRIKKSKPQTTASTPPLSTVQESNTDGEEGSGFVREKSPIGRIKSNNSEAAITTEHNRRISPFSFFRRTKTGRKASSKSPATIASQSSSARTTDSGQHDSFELSSVTRSYCPPNLCDDLKFIDDDDGSISPIKPELCSEKPEEPVSFVQPSALKAKPQVDNKGDVSEVCCSGTSTSTASAQISSVAEQNRGFPQAKLKEIVAVLDKLYKLAGELTPRPAAASLSSLAAAGISGTAMPYISSKICPSRGDPPTGPLAVDGEREAIAAAHAELYNRIREITLRVSQLESRLNHGNELLQEVRNDLQNRVDCIRKALNDKTVDGSQRAAEEDRTTLVPKLTLEGSSLKTSCESANQKTQSTISPGGCIHPGELLLQNKMPFWNEGSQIYQLDFNGRVTQESAKNFQIEFQGQQVMQFGRIEGSAFTLDFQAPFSAVQAFAVALASITQRLK